MIRCTYNTHIIVIPFSMYLGVMKTFVKRSMTEKSVYEKIYENETENHVLDVKLLYDIIFITDIYV